MLHLKEKYKKEVVPAMREKFGYKNNMAVPKIEKIIVNSCFGKQLMNKTASEKKKIIDSISAGLSLISGQKPKLVQARKSVSTFKLRKGMPIALKITMRGSRMYDFLERLVWIVLPRTRDFRGIDLKKVDRYGNLTIGFQEYSPFPELVVEKEKSLFGLEVTIVTSAKTREEGIELMRLIGIPLKK